MSSVGKHNMWSYYGWFVVVVIRQQTYYVVVIRLDFSWLSLVCKQNAWSYRYYGWACRCFHPSVNTICCRIMIEFVVVVVCHYTQCLVVLWFVCCCCHPSVNTLCGRSKVGLVALNNSPRFVLNSCMVHTPEQMWMYNFVKCSFCVHFAFRRLIFCMLLRQAEQHSSATILS